MVRSKRATIVEHEMETPETFEMEAPPPKRPRLDTDTKFVPPTTQSTSLHVEHGSEMLEITQAIQPSVPSNQELKTNAHAMPEHVKLIALEWFKLQFDANMRGDPAPELSMDRVETLSSFIEEMKSKQMVPTKSPKSSASSSKVSRKPSATRYKLRVGRTSIDLSDTEDTEDRVIPTRASRRKSKKVAQKTTSCRTLRQQLRSQFTSDELTRLDDLPVFLGQNRQIHLMGCPICRESLQRVCAFLGCFTYN